MIFHSSIAFRPRCVTEFRCVLIEGMPNEKNRIFCTIFKITQHVFRLYLRIYKSSLCKTTSSQMIILAWNINKRLSRAPFRVPVDIPVTVLTHVLSSLKIFTRPIRARKDEMYTRGERGTNQATRWHRWWLISDARRTWETVRASDSARAAERGSRKIRDVLRGVEVAASGFRWAGNRFYHGSGHLRRDVILPASDFKDVEGRRCGVTAGENGWSPSRT